MFGELLLAVDGSESADAAVTHAGAIARAFGSTVHVLSVVDERTLDNAAAAEERDELADRLVASVADDLEGDGVDTVTHVRTATPSEAIVAYAADRGVDLVLLGSHEWDGMRGYVLGNVAEGVVRGADAPVLTVPPSDQGDDVEVSPYRRVLVPTDGSAGAATALDPAASLATTFDADVHALSVVDTAALGVDIRSSVLFEDLEEHARAAVDELEDRAISAGVHRVETAVVHGTPATEIERYVADHDVDLVAMGTHGRAGIERYLLGSVTERVLRTASVPVLTVRAPEGWSPDESASAVASEAVSRGTVEGEAESEESD